MKTRTAFDPGVASAASCSSAAPHTLLRLAAGLCLFLAPVMSAQVPAGMVLIDSAGRSIHIGASTDDSSIISEIPRRLVTFTRGFYLGETEVTYDTWSQVRDWALTNGYPSLPAGQNGAVVAIGATHPGRPAGTVAERLHPVTTIHWYDAVIWCNARSEMEGLTPCYTLRNGGGIVRSVPAWLTELDCNWAADGYRLPTSAEWEYAARGGVDDGRRFPWGEFITHDNASYRSNYDADNTFAYDQNPTAGCHPIWNGTAPAGTFPATGFGLHEMTGNVSEWVWDWEPVDWRNPYVGLPDPDIDPRGPVSGTVFSSGWIGKTARGGDYYESAVFARAAALIFPRVSDSSTFRGFRVARTVVSVPATVALGSLSHTYDGQAKAATAATEPPGLAVTLTYSGSTTAPLAAGVYGVVATINDSVYAGSATGTLIILPAVCLAHAPIITTTAGGATSLAVTIECGAGATCQWQVLRVDDTGEWVDIPGATGTSYAIPSSQAFHSGTYQAVVAANGASTTSELITVSVTAPEPSDSRLLNLSTRAMCLTGSDVLIPGFVVSGDRTKRLLIRAVGATLGELFDMQGVLPDPRMQLKRWNRAIPPNGAYEDVAFNDDWCDCINVDEIRQTAAELWAFPLGEDNADAALLVDLAPGQYTVLADDSAGASGVAIVELYDADSPAAHATRSRLINLSNRGYVGHGADVMIPGFVISSEGAKTVLLRAVGPQLTEFGVIGVLADPKLTVYRAHPETGVNELILANDNWGENGDVAEVVATATRVGAFELAPESKDSAFVVSLLPGVYTVHASGADGGTGVALVEVYVVE